MRSLANSSYRGLAKLVQSGTVNVGNGGTVGLECLDGVLVGLKHHGAGLGNAILAGGEEGIAHVGGDLLNGFVGNEDDADVVGVAAERQVRGDLGEAVGEVVGDGVLTAVHGALLDRGEQLAVGHGGSLRADGVEDTDVDRVLHGADLQALEIIHGIDGLGGEAVTEAGVQISADVQALFGGLVRVVLTELAFHGLLDVLVALKEERAADRAELGALK